MTSSALACSSASSARPLSCSSSTCASRQVRQRTRSRPSTLSLAGDPYNLPIFLDGLHRQRALNHVVSLEGRGGLIGQFQVRVRYYRPAAPDTGWVAPRLAAEEPEHAAAAALLEQAAWLSVWRRFQWEERGLVERAGRIRARVSRELAAPLITVRAGGGSLYWDAEQGARLL